MPEVKRKKYTSPKTGKEYQVLEGANFQTDFLYEFPEDAPDEQVKNDYGTDDQGYNDHWKIARRTPEPEDSPQGDELLAKLFGDFRGDVRAQEKFAEENIVELHFSGPLSKIKGPKVGSTFHRKPRQKEGSYTFLRCNKVIVDPLSRALGRIFAFSAASGYKIKGFHSFEWRLKDSGKISNHCLGIAIDINASDNWFGDPVWDMPKQVVQIMQEEGFYWGGSYSKRWNKDPQHFEYKLEKVLKGGFSAGRVTFPLSKPNQYTLEPPGKYYQNNEDPRTGFGGYYGLGLRRNLHGGVHLFPNGKGPTPVNAVAWGHIAAVRLPKKGAGESPEAISMVRNWNGFVLVRHDVSMLFKGKEKPERGTFYSLYMHLAPIRDLKSAKEPYLQSVPWFQNAMKMRYGTWTKIADDTEGDPLGTTYWAAEPYDQNAVEVSVHGRKGKDKIRPKAADGKTPLWFFKATSVDFEKVTKALDEGKMVTFNEPFFPIGPGEAVGIAEPRQDSVGDVFKEAMMTVLSKDGKREKRAYTSGFIHWEVFAPIIKGTSTMRQILDLARQEFPELESVLAKDNVVSETTQDNFLDIEEMRSQLLGRLDKTEQPVLNKAIDALEHLEKNPATQPGAEFSYAGALVSAYAGATDFAPKTPKSDAQGELVDDDYTYPLTLQIELDVLNPPETLAVGEAYEIEVVFLKASEGVGAKDAGQKRDEGVPFCTQKLIINKGLFTSKQIDDPVNRPAGGDKGQQQGTSQEKPKVLALTLRVPAEATNIRLTAGKNVVVAEPAAPASEAPLALFKALVPRRWRGTRFTHLTEWAPSSLEKLLNKLKEKGMAPANLSAEALAPLTWWTKKGALSTSRWFVGSGVLSPEAQQLIRPPEEETVKAVDSVKNSLFGNEPGQLPPDAMVDNLHPVTMVWLLDMLRKEKADGAKPGTANSSGSKNAELVQTEALSMVAPDRAQFVKEDGNPLAWGWVFDKGSARPVLGDQVHAMVIDDDFGYDHNNKLTIGAESGGLRLTLRKGVPYRENGVLFATIPIDFWGKWKLSIPSAKSGPKATINTLTLDIPAPGLLDTKPEHPEDRRHAPVRVGKGIAWAIRVDEKVTPATAIAGFIGIETSKDGRWWSEAVVEGQHPYIAAHARRAPGGPVTEVLAENFRIEKDSIVNVSDKGRKEKKLLVTKSIPYSSYLNAYRDIRITCSLAQALHEIGCDRLTVLSLSSDGRTCVVMAGGDGLVKAAEDALGSGHFRFVGVWSQPNALTKEELAAEKGNRKSERLNALHERGLQLVIREPLKPVSECAAILAPNVVTSPDGLYVTGMVNENSSITSRLKIQSIRGRAPAVISCRLAQGLELLHLETKKKFEIVYLSREGDTCRLNAPGLLSAATANPCFAHAEVQPVGKQKQLVIHAPALHAATAVFDASAVLRAIRKQELKNGYLKTPDQALLYRFYFCAVNGFSAAGGEMKTSSEGGYGFQQMLRGLQKGGPHAVVARCPVPSGRLRALSFGAVQHKLVEKELVLDVPLRGQADLWKGVSVKVVTKGGQKALEREVTVSGDNPSRIGLSLPCPAENKVTLDLDVSSAPDPDTAASISPSQVTLDIEPAVIGGKLNLVAIDNYLVVWCRLKGVPSPVSGDVALRFAEGDSTQIGSVVGPPKKPTTAPGFILEVKPLTPSPSERNLQKRIEYYVQNANKAMGHCTHSGVFAARILKSHLQKEKTYVFTLGTRSPVRGKLVRATAELRTDQSYGPDGT